MKRLFALLVMAGMCFVACGPSAEEIAKEQQRKDDSIAAVKAAEDAAAQAAAEEAAAKLAAEEEAAKAAAAEEEAAKAKKPATVKKTTAEPVKTEPAPAAEPAKKSKLSGATQTN